MHASVENDAPDGTPKSSSVETSITNEKPNSNIMHTAVVNKGDQIANSSLMLDGPSKQVALEGLLHQTSILPEVHESSDEPGTIEINSKVGGLKLGDKLKENDSTSILEKIFGNSFTANISNTMDPVEVIVAINSPLLLPAFCN